MHILLERLADAVRLTVLDARMEAEETPLLLSEAEWPAAVAEHEAEHPRWVWDDTRYWYPRLLAAGVRIERCHDLRLSRQILLLNPAAALEAGGSAERLWWQSLAHQTEPRTGQSGQHAAQRGRWAPQQDALFELVSAAAASEAAAAAAAAPQLLAQLRAQWAAIDGLKPAGRQHRLRLLLAAESAGALIAAELEHFGLPWNVQRHDALLTELLGARPEPGARPAVLQALLQEIRTALDDPEVNPDSPQELLKRLQLAGMQLRSTSKWELREIKHPAIMPLLDYKRRARIMIAHGWNWIDQWVDQGRFHPVYTVGGVVTGRWATDGGGAMQLPAQIRGAVMADPGWKLVVADAAQLEPRILSAMSRDAGMLRAGSAGDLYQGIVDAGAVATRDQAKYGMLGALYGGTSGESGRMLPRLARAFPEAMGLVEQAARAGEGAQQVSTWLGRHSPRPQSGADLRSWGRFTRNFVVQGSAAEWAMSWMAILRGHLLRLGGGEAFGEVPRLVFFLHDEVIVHAPQQLAEQTAELVQRSADEAGRLLFGEVPVRFPLSVSVVDSYDEAK